MKKTCKKSIKNKSEHKKEKRTSFIFDSYKPSNCLFKNIKVEVWLLCTLWEIRIYLFFEEFALVAHAPKGMCIPINLQFCWIALLESYPKISRMYHFAQKNRKKFFSLFG